MATKEFSTPNWMQSLVAREVGIRPEDVVVRMEDDTRIVFQTHKTRAEISVNKTTGNVLRI